VKVSWQTQTRRRAKQAYLLVISFLLLVHALFSRQARAVVNFRYQQLDVQACGWKPLPKELTAFLLIAPFAGAERQMGAGGDLEKQLLAEDQPPWVRYY
jgi:hypothetical protein